jgi:hypothetical protein
VPFTSQLHLAPRLRLSGAITLNSVSVFMACIGQLFFMRHVFWIILYKIYCVGDYKVEKKWGYRFREKLSSKNKPCNKFEFFYLIKSKGAWLTNKTGESVKLIFSRFITCELLSQNSCMNYAVLRTASGKLYDTHCRVWWIWFFTSLR